MPKTKLTKSDFETIRKELNLPPSLDGNKTITSSVGENEYHYTFECNQDAQLFAAVCVLFCDSGIKITLYRLHPEKPQSEVIIHRAAPEIMRKVWHAIKDKSFSDGGAFYKSEVILAELRADVEESLTAEDSGEQPTIGPS